MWRLLSLLGLLPTAVLAQQAVPPLGTAALVCAYNTSIPVPAAGTFAYVQCDANGKLLTTGGGGGISGPGTTVVGNISAWDSTTGAALADSGISLSSQAAGLFLATPSGFSGAPSFRSITAADLGSYTLTPLFLGVGLKGASSGNDTISSLNSSTSSRTINIPAGTVNDTLALLGAGQTFSGANTFSGTVAHSAANTFSGTASFTGGPTASAGNTTSIQGNTSTPTLSNTGMLALGGIYAPQTLATSGTGSVSVNATNGLQLSGAGTANYVSFVGGGAIKGVVTGSGLSALGYVNYVNNHLWISGTAPTVLTGFATSGASFGTANGTLRFDVNIGAVGGSATGGFTLPTASTDWKCHAQSKNNYTSYQIFQTAYGTTSATLGAYSFANPPVSTNFSANDVIAISCIAN